MDRDLETALLTSVVAAIGAFGIWERLKEGYVSTKGFTFTRRDNRIGFWSAIFLLLLCDTALIGIAIYHLVAWL